MSYIDAGYVISLTVLAGYAGQLWHRRRRLERLAARTQTERAQETAGTEPAGRDETAARTETKVGA